MSNLINKKYFWIIIFVLASFSIGYLSFVNGYFFTKNIFQVLLMAISSIFSLLLFGFVYLSVGLIVFAFVEAIIFGFIFRKFFKETNEFIFLKIFILTLILTFAGFLLAKGREFGFDPTYMLPILP